MSRLQSMERQLLKAAQASPVGDEGFSNRVLNMVMAEAKEEAAESIKEIQTKLDKAETVIVELRAEIALLNRQILKQQQEGMSKSESMRTEAKQEMCKTMEAHTKSMQKMQAALDDMRQNLATEQQARARAESECSTAKAMCDKLDRIIAKMQADKPVQVPATPAIMPAATKLGPLNLRVSQRDQNGRIAAMTIEPTT